MIELKMKNKKSQEEMVGFALIMIIVAVVLLVFLGLSLRNPQQEEVESYEVDSFISSFLQYTTDCEENYETNYFSIEDLISSCADMEDCFDGRGTCEVLEETIKELVERSWDVGEDNPVKGYELKISLENQEILLMQEGNVTKNYKSSVHKGGKGEEIIFSAYY